VRVNSKVINDYDFRLSEHYDTGTQEFNRIIMVSVAKYSKIFFLNIFVDGKEVYHNNYNSYEEILEILTDTYMFLPDKGTTDYSDLLTESLNEWQLMNPSARQAQATSSKTNKEKFKELTDYMVANANFVGAKKVSQAKALGIDDDKFAYREYANMNGQDFILTLIVNYGNKHNPSSTAWKYELYMDTQFIKEVKGNGMEELLQELKGNFKVPNIGSPEYKSLTESLNEWQLMNQPKASQPASTAPTKTNKEKFVELVYYMQKHKDSSVIFTSATVPIDTGFEYEEQRSSANGDDYNLSVKVSLGKHDLFTIHVDKDGKRVYNIMAKGWEELLRYLRIYFHAPNMGSPEYKSLTESFSSELKEWKPMNPTKPAQANNTFDNTYRYQRLLAQIDSDGIATYKVNKLDNVELDITVDTANQKGLHLNIFDNVPDNPNAEDYSFTVGNKASGGWKYDEEILPMLIAGRVMQNDDLCESAGSIADDFKLYENLWN
jgi:hypothetical protein